MNPTQMVLLGWKGNTVGPLTLGTPGLYVMGHTLGTPGTQAASWSDGSGTGHHLTQSTTANQPQVDALGAGKALYFDGLSRWMIASGGWFPPTNQPYSFYCAMNNPQVQAAQIGSSMLSTGGLGDGIGLRINGSTQQLRIKTDGQFHDANIPVGRSILTVINTSTGSASGTITIRNNGAQLYTAACARDNGANHAWIIGATNDTGSAPLKGTIGAMIIYPAAHNLASIQAVEAYLNEYYPSF